MKIFISKQEIEELNNEKESLIANYGGKEIVLTELISIKIYNLIKTNFSLSNEYINRIFTLSSFCPNINLPDHNIKDTDILIRFKNNTLSSFIFDEHSVTKDFVAINQISNDLILSMNEDANSEIKKPFIIDKLLNSSNVQNIILLRNNVEKKLITKFDKEFNEKVTHNIFIASQFREETFNSLDYTDKEKLLRVISDNDCSVGEYIHAQCRHHVVDIICNYIKRTLNGLKDRLSLQLLNIDNLYSNISVFEDALIRDLLYSELQYLYLIDSPLQLIDLVFAEKEFANTIKEQQKKQDRENNLKRRIAEYNDIFDEINYEILRVLFSIESKVFNVNYDDSKVSCNHFYNAVKYVNIEGIDYKFNYLKFTTKTDYHGFFLDAPVQLTNTLTLRITDRGRLIYSLSEEIKNKLLAAQKELSKIIDIDNDYQFIC